MGAQGCSKVCHRERSEAISPSQMGIASAQKARLAMTRFSWLSLSRDNAMALDGGIG